MANYEALARSNYFRVNDPEAFAAFCEKYQMEMITREKNGATLYGFILGESLPTSWYDEDSDETLEVDLSAEIAEHLVEGDVAILMESGHVKLASLSGYAMAVNSAGVTRWLSIDGIHEIAKELGPNITPCAN